MTHEVFKNIGQTATISLQDLDKNRGLASNEDEAKVEKAVMDFFRDMISIDGVKAVAFSLVEDSPAPANISIAVFAPLEDDDERSSDIVHNTLVARSKLYQLGNEHPIFRVHLNFWNTKNTDFVDLEREFRNSCLEDKSCQLIGIYDFRRDVPVSL